MTIGICRLTRSRNSKPAVAARRPSLVGVLIAVRLATSSVSAHVDELLFGLLFVTFTAGLIVFGGLVRSSEILALRASGASLIRIVRAPTLLALLVTVGFATRKRSMIGSIVCASDGVDRSPVQADYRSR